MSRSFPGTSPNYLYNPASSVWQNLTQWTISAWVYPTAARASQACSIVTCDLGGAGRIPFGIHYGKEGTVVPNGCFWSGFWDTGSWRRSYYNGAPALNQWYHVAGTWNGTTNRFYLNGLEGVSDTSGANGAAGGTRALDIGRRWDTSGGDQAFFPGRICEVAIWSLAYTNATDWNFIKALARGVSPLRLPHWDHLVGYWPIFGDGSYPEVDVSGNAYNLSSSGTTPLAPHAPVGRLVPMAS